MADTNVKFDESAVKQKFEKLEAQVKEKAGLKGFNPFVWFKDNVKALKDKFHAGDRSAELAAKIASLPAEIPATTSVPPEPPKVAPPSNAPTQATGLKLPSK